MAALEAGVRAIEQDGLLWGASKLVPIGYGIKKLQITLVVGMSSRHRPGLGGVSDRIFQRMRRFPRTSYRKKLLSLKIMSKVPILLLCRVCFALLSLFAC